jgi:hypothetical protein
MNGQATDGVEAVCVALAALSTEQIARLAALILLKFSMQLLRFPGAVAY